MKILHAKQFKLFFSNKITYGLVTALFILAIPHYEASAANLPRPPKPTPLIPHTQPIKPQPNIKIGTRPSFNPSKIGALPDLVIMRGVRTTINPRVLSMCRAGKKDRENGSIPVLNFSFRIKNKGKGTAYMNRDGVIVSAQQTNDFHERVLSTSKYYLGGKGGPGHFINYQGNRQNWILKKMAHFLPGKVINATSHLGISYNNTHFTLNRLQELAGQTHKFLLKLTSYGSPGLKESNSRNNQMLVSFTFPRNFCKATARPVGVPVPVALPDLKIVRVTPRLDFQASNACKTGQSPNGRLVGFDLKVKNKGAGVADLSKYNIAIHATSADGQSPAMQGGDGYSRARRTPAKVAPGQTFTITGASGVTGSNYGHTVTFPVSRYSELAGKTRRFKVEVISGTGIGHGLSESNYNNNSYKVSYTFPRNFCKATARPVRPETQTVPVLPDFLITKLTPPNSFACSAAAGHISMGFFHGGVVIKNIGGNPTYATAEATTHSNFTIARRTSIPGTHLRFRMTGGIKYRDMPKAGQTISSSFAVGLWDDSKRNGQGTASDLAKAMRWLRGRTLSIPIQINGPQRANLDGKPLIEGNTRNNLRNLRVRFPGSLCQN